MKHIYTKFTLYFNLMLLIALILIPITQSSAQTSEPAILVDEEKKLYIFKEEDPQFYYVTFNFSSISTINIEVNDPSGSFTIALDNNSDHSTEVTATTYSNGRGEAMIWVKYSPKTTGNHKATITHTGPTGESVTINIEGNSTSIVMPVDLISFKATLQNQAAILNWATAMEKDNSHFEVELSEGLKQDFIKIGSIKSKAGTSYTTTHYSFNYTLPNKASTYYFRLKQVDEDGSYSYSKVVTVSTSATASMQVVVAPNPLTTASGLYVIAPEPGLLNADIINLNGVKVYSRKYTIAAGSNQLALPLDPTLPTGIYILTTEVNGSVKQLKLIKDY